MPKSLNASLIAATVIALAPLAAQAQGQQPAMPEGEGKLLVDGLCVTCHRTNMITNSLGYTREGWKELIGTMIDLSANPDMRDKLTALPRAAFPAEHRARAHAGVRPRADHVEGMGEPAARPALARSDAGARRIDLVGRAIRQRDRPARSEDRRDEGISAAGQRLCRTPSSSMPRATPGTRATRTARSAISIPKTGQDHRLQDARSRTRRIRTRWCSTRRASLWFTLQNSNMVGRLDPESGDIKLVTLSDAEREALRHQDRRRGQSLVLLQRQPVPLQDQSGEHGADRGQAAA